MNLKKKVTIMLLYVLFVCCLGCWPVKAADIVSNDINPWDVIAFGSYEQDNDLTNGPEPIEWYVLSVDNDEALLLSKYCLDYKPYNDKYEPVTWEKSSLREWLNNEFYNKAFNDIEKNIIVESLIYNSSGDVSTDSGYRWFVEGGNNTLDKVFLLSKDEITESDFGFQPNYDVDYSRNAQASQLAIEHGASWNVDDEGVCDWWLRTPGRQSTYAIEVSDGCVSLWGDDVSFEAGVRPALYIKIEKNDRKYKGDINIDGEINAKDVTQLRRYLAGGWNVNVDKSEADLNEDKEINAKDVTLLRRYLAGGWGVVLPQRGVASEGDVAINRNNFPDRTFRKYLADTFDTNEDGVLDVNEIKDIEEIDVTEMKINDVSGIQYFSSLTKLYCSNNYLKNIDVSNNYALEKMNCSYNQLKSLDVSNNENLMEMDCGVNPLTNLDVSSNSNLTKLSCSSNQLTSLDVGSNINLTELYCSSNQLTSLDVSSNINLTELSCSKNQLTSLDVSNNLKLNTLFCYRNLLNRLDLRHNTALCEFECYDNNITYVDIPFNLYMLTGSNYYCDEDTIIRYNLGIMELSDILLKDSVKEYCENNFNLDSNVNIQWKINENGTVMLYYTKVRENGSLEMDEEIDVADSLKIVTINYYDDKERKVKSINKDEQYVFEYEYDNNDRIVKKTESYSDRGIYEYEYSYYSDDTIKTVAEKHTDNTGSITWDHKSYDLDGNLINGYQEDSSGKICEYSTEFYENGKVKKIVDDHYYRWNNATIIFEFDENGDMVRRTTKEDTGSGSERVIVRDVVYDEQNRVITGFEKIDDRRFGIDWFYVENTYDKSDRLIKKYYSWDDTLDYIRDYQYTYDELNRLIFEKVYIHNWDTGYSYNTEYIYEGNSDLAQKVIFTDSRYRGYDVVTITEYNNGVVVRKTVTHVDYDGNDTGYLYVEEYTNGVITESRLRETAEGETIILNYDAEGKPVGGNIDDETISEVYDAEGRLIQNYRYTFSYYDEGDVSYVEMEDSLYDSTRKYSFNKGKGIIINSYLKNGLENKKELFFDTDFNILLTHTSNTDADGFTEEFWNDKDGVVLKERNRKWSSDVTYESVYEYFVDENGQDCRKILSHYSDGSVIYRLQQRYFNGYDFVYYDYEYYELKSDGSYIKRIIRRNDQGGILEPYIDIKIDKDGNAFVYDEREEEYCEVDNRIEIM
jgi:hypothetical protein